MGRVACTCLIITYTLLTMLAQMGCARANTQPPGQDDGGSGQDGAEGDGGTGGPDGGGSTWDGTLPCDPDPLPVTAGGLCANAIDLGSLTDSSGDAVVVTGNSVPQGREVWWSFQAVDDVDTAGDEFHVDIRFLVNPGDAYELAVYRGGCAAGYELTAKATSFDWYTDFNTTSTGCTMTAPCGEGDCVPAPAGENVNSCDDDTTIFYVRVRRTDGAESCDGFTLELSNGKYSAM